MLSSSPARLLSRSGQVEPVLGCAPKGSWALLMLGFESIFDANPYSGFRREDSFLQFPALERYCQLAGVNADSVCPEEQHSDYEAGVAAIAGASWRIRTARVTPSKPGAFVALWHRNRSGQTAPFPEDNKIAGVLVFVSDGPQFGVFAFDTSHLLELGILDSAGTKGKRGFRVYPSWCHGLNPQATKSQKAQSRAFSLLAT